MKHTGKKIVLAAAILSLGASTLFANPYTKCVGCHGANGEKVALGKSKIIKDMTKQEIIDAMVGYQNGTYGGPMKGLMLGQVKGVSQADIEAIANQIGK